ncbi:MAG TPA: DUF3429 domain-containing protein [Acetobacteraceae bacterium]|nr:DUF3429 domain-containing protein [Acetobacteraceae bacterium]
MPPVSLLLSLLGLVPFVIGGLAALGHNPEPADRALMVLIDYAALVLAFAGGIHWGLALGGTLPTTVDLAGNPASPVTTPPRMSRRIVLGVMPLLIGWAALLLAQIIATWMALVLLIAGYLATMIIEHEARRHVAYPARYLWLRWAFTIVAVAMLTTALTLRLFGQTIVF